MKTLKEKIEDLIKELDKKAEMLYRESPYSNLDALSRLNRNSKAWVYAEVADKLEEILEEEGDK